MRVVIGCERSGIVRDAFIAKGHNAVSVDLLKSENNNDWSKHIVCDIIDYLNGCEDHSIDLLGLHPECTKLCVSGNHVYARGKPKYKERLAQVVLVMELWELSKRKAKRIYLENPVGVLSTMGFDVLPKPFYIQPYLFGENASKKTALFLHNLEPLKPTNRFPGRVVEWPKGSGKIVERWANQTDSGQNVLGPSNNRWMERSRTYQGIANAFSNQWG